MSVFVTGAASFIGQQLIRQCADTGLRTTGVDLVHVRRPGFTVADIRDPEFRRTIPEGTEAAIHLAGLSRPQDCSGRMADWLETNVMASCNVLRAAVSRGVRQVIFASSEWVYDQFGEAPCREDEPIDPLGLTSEYGLSKLLAEMVMRREAERAGIALTVLRFGIVYGPRPSNWSAVESLYASVARDESVTVGSRATARHFIHVADVAAAIRASIGQDGCETFNIQGPALVTLGEVIDIAMRMAGRRPKVVESDPGRPSIRRVSSALARARLGWQAEIDIETGIRSLKGQLEAA